MRAEKKQKVITTKRIVLPNANAYKALCEQFNINETTLKNYLNVSANRTANKAIDVQVTAINDFRGRLVENTDYSWTLVVYDDDETILYELD